MSVTVRPMRAEDTAQVAAIEKETFTQPWTQEGFLESLELDYCIYVVAVAEDETVLGYSGLRRSFEEADVTNMAVASEARGKGIGEMLLRALMEMGREQGIERYTLEVRKSNEPAIRMYHKLGYEDAGIRKNFYSHPQEDAIIMWTKDRSELND